MMLAQILRTSNLHRKCRCRARIDVRGSTHSQVRPSIVIQLPRKGSIIVSTGVALITCRHCFGTRSSCAHRDTLRRRVTSIHGRVHLLKHGSCRRLPKLQALSCILVFVPIRPTFLLTLSHRPRLVARTLGGGVVLIDPAALLITLHAVTGL